MDKLWTVFVLPVLRLRLSLLGLLPGNQTQVTRWKVLDNVQCSIQPDFDGDNMETNQ